VLTGEMLALERDAGPDQ